MKKIITYFLIAFFFASCRPVESSDRDECPPAFERLLGISPPEMGKATKWGKATFLGKATFIKRLTNLTQAKF